MRLGFNFRWFKGENCSLIDVSILSGNYHYFEIIHIKVLKFVASIHVVII